MNLLFLTYCSDQNGMTLLWICLLGNFLTCIWFYQIFRNIHCISSPANRNMKFTTITRSEAFFLKHWEKCIIVGVKKQQQIINKQTNKQSIKMIKIN